MGATQAGLTVKIQTSSPTAAQPWLEQLGENGELGANNFPALVPRFGAKNRVNLPGVNEEECG